MQEQFFNRPELFDYRKSMRDNPTQAEKVLWSFLRAHRSGYKFRRQHGIGPFIVDFYCPKCRLVVEVDGITHQNEEAKKYDEDRTRYLRDNNIQVIRFSDNEVLEDIHGCIGKIVALIEGLEKT